MLQALSSEDLDAIEQASGYRVGVQVVRVVPGSPAEKSGLKQGYILFAVGERGVDSPQVVNQSLAGKSGPVELIVARMGPTGELEVVKMTLTLPGGGGPAVPQGTAPPKGAIAQTVGLVLQALSKEDLETIQAQTGHRVGVLVIQVSPGSAAGKAGFKGRDVLLPVGHQGVDSPAAVEQALAGKASAEILLMRPGGNKYEALKVTLEIPAASVPASSVKPSEVQSKLQALEATHQAGLLSDEEYARKKAELLGSAAAEPTVSVSQGEGIVPGESSPGDPVNAYFDMLDFVRTQAWERPTITSAAGRQRVAALLKESEAELGPQVKSAIQQIPHVWAALQKRWAESSAEKRAEQREFWRTQLLLPNQIVPPPENTETFHARGDTVQFDYPSGWIQAQTEGEGTPLLYLGPPATETSWEQVLDGANSPPGVLFAIAPIDEVEGMGFLDTARGIAQRYVTGNAPEMKEVQALNLGKGALVSFVGRFPGQTEEKFYWVGVVPVGSEHFLVGRFGGTAAQAETLLPAFLNVLATLEIKPPDDSEELRSLTIGLATSIIGNAVVSTNW